MKKNLRHVLIVLGLSVLGSAAGMAWRHRERQVRERDGRAVAEKSVGQWLEHSCLPCHGPDRQSGDLRLDTLRAALLGGKSGPALVPGHPEKSPMLELVRQAHPKKQPASGEVRDKRVVAMETWIKAGAAWPADFVTAAAPGKADTALGDAWKDPRNPIARLFGGKRLDLWSLQPVSHPSPPAVKNEAWVRNGIDRFVLARLEAAGAQPAPEADRRTLVRRLYLDLTGLPPSPEECAAFIQDPAPEAYQNLVQRLLDSPRYGEHAARAWLDLVRYSDSNGFDYDEFRPQAWRYRDYVIRALNADKPYDRFLSEQIAGDEMVADAPQHEAEQDCLTATGFLRIGPYDNSAAKFGDKDLCRVQVMSDVVETTAATFMGLAFSCCRCHDHKVDPISQADYYRLRACFEGVEANDKVLLDLKPKRKTIDAELAVIEAARSQLAQIKEAASGRIRQEKIAKLPPEARDLLALPPADPDPMLKTRLKNLRKSVEPSDAEVLAAYRDDEKKEREQITTRLQELEQKRSPYTPGFAATDMALYPPQTFILAKGDLLQPTEPVPPGVLSIFDPNPLPPSPTVRPRSPGRRTALAAWLADATNPLTARVMVNRVWQGHFQTGLQATPNDFGYAGARPSDPALLDWLATEFTAQGWSLKKLHRLIVESATYRQSPGADGGTSPVVHKPHRLTAEALRDSMLLVSGSLRPCDGGPPLWPALPEEILSSNPGLLVENEEKTRGWYPSAPDLINVRSIFLVQKRSLHLPMLETFDLPDNNLSCGRRNTSTVAPEALTLLNSGFTAEMAEAFARRLEKEAGHHPESLVARAFACALQRNPDAEELEASVAFLKEHNLPELCRALFNLNEFAYVD